MKQISVILAHPHNKSFNHAIANIAIEELQKNKYRVLFHDLYGEKFDPILPEKEIPEEGSVSREVLLHCEEISDADGIIIVHPNWWGQPPAILKGWVDRVLRPGVGYKFLEGDSGEGIPVGLLKAQSALVFNTSNTHREREMDVFGDPLETIWKNCIFNLCGIKNFYRETFQIVITSSKEQRHRWLEQVRTTVNKYYPML